MLKTLQNNNRGVIFVTVLMIIIVMIAITITILSLNVTRVTTAEDEVRRIQAETLATGALSYAVASQQGSTPANNITLQETMGNTLFSVDILRSTSATGPNATDPLTISVSY